MDEPRSRRRWVRELSWHALGILVTIAVFEVVLRIANFPYLRADDWGSLQYGYDAELGWSPVPNSRSTVALPRETSVSHNSLGVRDAEFQRDGKPTILFVGDSLTWGYNLEVGERFSDLIRGMIPAYNVVNAGVSGYGTDQEYLMAKRLWPVVEPSIVVLMFCVENDHTDNSQNMRYFNYKPYVTAAAGGGLEFRGQPAPRPRRSYFSDNWLGRHSMLARLAISAYVEVRYRRVTVPDPTTSLIGMLRDEVQRRGARLFVGLERDDPPVEDFLKQQAIPYTRFDGAELYDSSHHWTPKGNALVAERLATLLAAHDVPVAPGEAKGVSGATPARH
jgi:hypothetical protein